MQLMPRTENMMKRFPRAVLFVGDHEDVPLGEDSLTWQQAAIVQFLLLGIHNVFDAGTIFRAMPNCED